MTNDLLKPIKRDINSSPDARRWRDIVLNLKQRVGEEKFRRESVRVRVVAIANLTLQLERMTEGVIEGGDGKLVRKANYDQEGRPRTLIYREGDPERIIHIIGQIQNLLRALGIKDDD